MKRILSGSWSVVLSSAALLLVASIACTPAAPAPQAPPAQQAAAPAGAAAAEQAGSAPREWGALVEAAKREGKVNCTCVPVPVVRDAVLREWAKDYPEIQMEYSFATLPDIEPQVTAERAAGQFVRDVYMFNPSPEQYAFASRGFFEDLRPLMILPDLASPDTWRGGFEERFQDDAKRTVFAAGAGINTMGINVGRHRELGLPLPDSPLDILKPEYKKQIVAWELRFGSGGSNYIGWWAFTFGLDDKTGVQALLNQEVTNLPGMREQTERLVRGGNLIAISDPNEAFYRPFREAGVQFEIKRQGREPNNSSMTALWAPSVFKNAASPNAAIVLFNWLLSKRVHETALSVAAYNSARLDVAPTLPEEAPVPALEYYQGQKESSIRDYRNPAMELARQYYR